MTDAGWLQAAVAGVVPTIVFISIFATMREKIANLEKRLDKMDTTAELERTLQFRDSEIVSLRGENRQLIQKAESHDRLHGSP